VTSDRVPTTGPPPDLDQIVVDACRQVGIAARRPRLLRHFANAVYLVEEVPVVVRVAYDQRAVARSRTAVSVTDWLAGIHFPVSEPVRLSGRQPTLVEARPGVAVSFWRYYPQPADGRQHDLRTLGEIAHRLHNLSADPPIPLDTYQPLRSIAQAVSDASLTGALDDRTVGWFTDRIDQLLHEYHALDFPLGVGLIHADMYAGNLLWNTRRPAPGTNEDAVVLGDWDSVCLGPREIDLAPTHTATRFGLDQTSIDRFVEGYGYDLRGWVGHATLRSMRELSTLTALVRLAPSQATAAKELRHRVGTLQDGDTQTVWARQ
jgi:Ser/Thr protein kinase RdoA (MazF antagonist)